MMNKLLLCSALLLGVTSAFADTTQKYTGNAPATVQNASDENGKQFYLYNLGTGQMLDKGGLWGTQPALGAGIAMTLETGSSNGTYAINTGFGSGQHLSYIDGSNTNVSTDYDQWYIDQVTSNGAVGNFTFTAVEGYTNVYTMSVTTTQNTHVTAGIHYLTVENNAITATTTAPTTEDGYWMLVTKQELLNEFKKAANGSAGASAVNATFVMKDYDFSRDNSDVSYWKRGTNGVDMQNHDKLTGSNSNCIKPSDATKTTTTTTKTTWSYTCRHYTGSIWGVYYGDETHTGTLESNTMPPNCGTHTGSWVKEFKANKLQEGSTTTTTTVTYPYYVGNGYGSNYSLSGSTSNGYTGNEGETVKGTSGHAQRYYGGDWTGNIHGKEGKLYQTVTVTLAAGKYTISCQGFSTDGSGKLFAQVGDATTEGDQYQTIALNKPRTTPNTYVSAARLINGSGYEKSVTVVVENVNTTITFGILVENGTDDAWSCFDNFSISYLGNAQNTIILDEDQTDYTYINKQVETDKTSTLYLKRMLKTGQWNSIVLPVDLTTDQVKEAFGADAKLSALNRTEADGKQIIFEPVSLTGSKTAIEKGKVYIIKPTVAIKTDATKKTSTKVTDLSVTSYYEISLVTLNTEVSSGSVVPTEVVGSTEDNGIKHCGTYVKVATTDGTAIPAQTYILSGGKWYYNTVGINTVKGFRGWIATNQSKGEAQETKFVINGVEDGTTAIEGITAEQPTVKRMATGVYSLNGQKVSDTNTTDGLAKGIYIVGGKKVVVK